MKSAALGLALASAAVAQAQPYYLAGAFQGWCNNCSLMTDNGLVGTNGLYGSHQWSYNITGQTPGSYDTSGMKVTDGTWNNTWPGSNFKNIYYDTNGSATFYFYPGTFGDGFTPTTDRIGFSDPGLPWEVTGDFTSPNWDTDPNAQMTLKGGSAGVYTNTYIVATPGVHIFKFRTSGTWSGLQVGSDFVNDGGGNAVVITSATNEPVTFVLDLVNGRWQAGGPPPRCDVQFSVDMTFVQQSDPGFDPTSVTVNGPALPGGWDPGNACTNNPNAANPNIYTSSNLSLLVGSSMPYQFRYRSSGNPEYDGVGGISGNNRSLTVPNLASTNIPTVFWNDASGSDVLDADTTVIFTVNMANAVGTDNVNFNDGSGHALFLNGDFLIPPWQTWNAISLSGYQLQVNGSGPTYSLSVTFLAGHTRALNYKYAIDGADDEAGYAQNHFRYIRKTGGGTYYLPTDTFGTQYAEPKVGGLTIGQKSGGTIPITWLPYPNVNLQTAGDLTSGTWQDVGGTTGGSATNWPVGSGAQFFRLKQP